MNFEETFPLRYWINLGRRGDRRGEMEWRLHQVGVTAERFPAVDARFVKRMALERRKHEIGSEDGQIEEKEAGALLPLTNQVRGYENAGRYALALTQRMVIRQAKLRGAEAVLLLEDDVIL